MTTKLTVMVFGQLQDITGSSVISIDDVADTDMLLSKLRMQYPLLKEKKFLIALDKKIIKEKTEINGMQTIALLPPFSGG
jgi:sulfur-carrier protein